MKTLLILRHAKSSWDDNNLIDYERPLNQRGRHDAPRMGRLLKHEDATPDLIISSSAKRALATAEAVAQASGYERKILVTRRLYHASPGDYLNVLNDLADNYKRVMVVGHNPGLEELVELLVGHYERMPTAALAQVQLPVKHWGELDEETEGELVNLWLPKEVVE